MITLTMICASERSERALRIVVYFLFSGTCVCQERTAYNPQQPNMHYSSSNINITCKQIVTTKSHFVALSNELFGHKFTLFDLDIFSTFLSLYYHVLCGKHGSMTSLTIDHQCQLTDIVCTCHTQSFHKHLLMICASERSERALRLTTYFISVGTHDYHKQCKLYNPV